MEARKTPWGLRPTDWELVPWSSFATRSGRPIVVEPDADLKQVTVRVRHQGVTERRLNRNRHRRIETPTQVQISAGQFVISKIDARNGACGFIPRELDGAIVTHDFPVYEINEKADSRYLDHLVDLPIFWRLCESVSDGTTNRVRLDLGLFDNLEFPMPSLPEQCAIAAVLDAIDEAIERTEAVIAGTERLRESLLHELLTRGVPGRHTAWRDVPGLGTVPACWEVVRLGTRARILSGAAFSSAYFSSDDGLPLIRNRDVNSSETELRYFGPYDQKYLIHPDDILVRMDGDFLAARWKGPLALLNQRVARVSVSESELDPSFLFHTIQKPLELIQRQTTGTTVKHLSAAQIAAVPIPDVPLAEQRVIAGMLDNVDAAIERAREERAALQSSKVSVADALLTGRVRVGKVGGG